MKRVLVTRARAQADSFAAELTAAGFEPICFPVIETRPIKNNTELDGAIKNIKKYAWIVFTSVNAVDVFFEQGQPTGVSMPNIAAIGPKTAEALRRHNVQPNFMPHEYIAEAILPGLGDLKNKWVLLPRAEIARSELPRAILNAGGIAHEIVVYQTLPAEVEMNGLNALKAGIDVITFTSASTVENFTAILHQNGLNPLSLPHHPLIICIGPITGQAARDEGFQNIVVAKEYTTEGLIETLANLEKS
jgi:uroporphyrinogen III methyltransferase/synthase